MRTWTCIATLLALLLVGCGEDARPSPSDEVRRRIDGLLKAGIEDLPSRVLPGNARKQRLYPDEDPVRETVGSHARSWLSKNLHGRALIAMDQMAIPTLGELLRDKEDRSLTRRRRLLAVVFLGEIGGPEAASTLLEAWRQIRDNARAKRAYIDNDGLHLISTVYETSDDQLVLALTHSLSLCGEHVTAELAADTRAALDAADALHADGKDVQMEEAREIDGRDAKLTWWVEPVETAKEGLGILSMIGGQDVVPLFERALRSPIRTIRWHAIQSSVSLAYEAQPLLPTLVEALLDPAFRAPALHTLQGLYMTGQNLKAGDPKPTEEEWAAIAKRWQARIETEEIPRTRTRTTTTSGHGG